MFIFNTQLLMIGIDSWWHLSLTVCSAVIAMLLFSAATQGYWFTRNRWWETVLLLLLTFTLFRPGFWWDKLYPPMEMHPGTAISRIAEQLPIGEPLHLQVSGMTLEGEPVRKTVHLPFAEDAIGSAARIASTGLTLRQHDQQVIIDMITFGSPAEQANLDFDWRIEQVIMPTDRPMKEWVFVPALFMTGFMAWNQLRRRRTTGQD